MEKTSLIAFGQPMDGQPSESPFNAENTNAKNANSAVGKPQPKSPPIRKKTVENLTDSNRPVFLHRIAEVRLQQGLSLRMISRRTGLTLRELRVQELPETNLSLQELHVWKDALEVPLEHLLVDRDLSVSESIQSRAILIRVMKTVNSLREIAVSGRFVLLLDMLRQQLVELMPELSKIQSWPSHGSRRGIDEFGRILHEPVVLSELSFQAD